MGGLWANGLTNGTGLCSGIDGGLLWHDMATQPGLVYNVSGSGFADGTAVLTGVWGANQYIYAVAKCKGTDTNPEIELRLRSTIAHNNINGYEGDFACNSAAGQFVHIVRWNGGFADFSTLTPGNSNGVSTGDIVEFMVNGSCVFNIKINNVAKGTATDCTFTGGNPGVGSEQGTGLGTDNGWTSYYATDSLVTVQPTCDHATGNYGTSFSNQCGTTSPGIIAVCWTSNGTTPVTNGLGTGCSNGTLMTNNGTVTIGSSQTFNIVAGTASLSDSTMNSYTYTIGSPPTSPSAPMTVIMSQLRK